MTCPRCKSEIPDNSVRCEVCDKKIKHKKDSSNKTGHLKKVSKQTKLKIALALGVTILILVAVMLIFKLIDDNSGLNLADELKGYIGEPVKVAINETDEYFADESKSEAANFICPFDYVVESEKTTEVADVEYPVWAVFINVDDDDIIEEIKYVDFDVLEKNDKGYKSDKEINLDRFTLGDKFRNLSKEIGIEPFVITYTNATIIYDYKYYFENESGQPQAMSLSVCMDNDMEYIYSTTQRVVPDWIY